MIKDYTKNQIKRITRNSLITNAVIDSIAIIMAIMLYIKISVGVYTPDEAPLFFQILFFLYIVIIVITTYFIAKGIRSLINYQKNKYFLRLGAKNNTESIVVSNQIDFEIANPILENKQYTLTNNFILRRSFYSFDAFLLSDLIWIFPKVIDLKMRGVTTGKSYCIFLRFRNKQGCFFSVSSLEDANQTINRIVDVSKNKNIVIGYSEERQKLFENNIDQFIMYGKDL